MGISLHMGLAGEPGGGSFPEDFQRQTKEGSGNGTPPSVRRTWREGSLTGNPEGYVKAGSGIWYLSP